MNAAHGAGRRPRPGAACRRGRGFTLVEILVALVIVAVGMGAVLAALSSAAGSTAHLRDKTFAQWIALNRIAEVRLEGRVPSKGKSTGDVEYAGRRWRWEQEVLELEVPGIVRLDVRVQPADSAQSKAWLGTATGVVGDAVAPPDGVLPAWDPHQRASRPGGPDGGEAENDDGQDTARQAPLAEEQE